MVTTSFYPYHIFETSLGEEVMRKIDCKPGDDLQKFAPVHNVGSLLGKQWGKYLLGSLLGNLNFNIGQLTSNYLIIL